MVEILVRGPFADDLIPFKESMSNIGSPTKSKNKLISTAKKTPVNK
jgi:hypothetical protein